ncbi:conserved exported hypothetical protein [Vibrio nigripulchritudo FTn2]|uniref:hypothetical protein n=1 Tax=Vibrio nigripulchritudo TaxID=28173 RepID=UPI0003B198F3|nr:hypothetical protein [Vibrio nigripulchritudo]CCN39729.1 conserved exported hypothetical protein [Vibrio nigripulchritudo FTn2]
MDKKFCSLLVLVGLAGCSSPSYEGQGEYFELVNVNVVERDLSVLKATVTTSTAKTPGGPVLEPKRVFKSFHLKAGEAYHTALKRWVKKEGYKNVAFNFSGVNEAVISDTSKQNLTFTGSLQKAVSSLAKSLQTPIRVVTDKKSSVAGLYDFNEQARITHVNGDDLKSVTQSVTLHYGYRFVDSSESDRSWLAKDNYQFGADYFIVTPKDDLTGALRTVLRGYPVRAQILESTSQVFILGENG